MASTPPPPPNPPGPAGYPPAGGYAPQPYPAQPYYAPVRRPFKRNAMLLLAQILAVIQGLFFLIVGALAIVALFVFRSQLQTYFNNNNVQYNGAVATVNVITGVFIGAAAVLIILGLLITFLAIRTGHPSQVARWFLAVIEILLFLGGLSRLSALGGNSAYAIGYVVYLGIIIVGLIIWPTTYVAYARRNLPAPATGAPPV